VNVLIVGAGAIGCLIGGKLARANQQVTLAGRPTFVEAVRSRGLILDDELGRHTVRNIRAVDSPLAALERSETAFDLVVFTVKSYDTATAVADLCQALDATGAPPPALLSMQNGVGNEDALAAALPSVSVLAGSITTPVSVEEPGVIHVDKPRYGLGLGIWRPGAAGTNVFTGTCHLLENAGFSVRRYEDAQAMKWTKLLMNMMGNATCAILGEPPQRAFADGQIVDVEIEAWRETLTVMAAAGIPALNLDKYPFALLAPLLRFSPKALIRPVLRSQIGGARGGKLPSLHIDLHGSKGRSEVGWLNGAVVRKGAEVGVTTPVNKVLTDTLSGMVTDPAEIPAWRGNHSRLLAAVKSPASAPVKSQAQR
jgi:2-dehydropantoate 2-reductase